MLDPETLTRLRRTAADGNAHDLLLLHLLERVESLEARPIPGAVELVPPTPEAAPKATLRNALLSAEAADHFPAATEMVPSADPLVAEDELVRCYAQAVEQALQAGSGINGAAAAGLRALHDLGRQHGAAQAPGALPAPMQRLIDAPMDARGYVNLREPAPPAAPAGGLAEKVLRELPAGTDLSCARAVIRVVKLWAGQLWLQRTERKLREEADQ
jgi:hypothetical protein